MGNQAQTKKPSGHGGYRPGSGRKPGAKSKRTEVMEQAIVARIEGVGGKLDPVEAMMDIAEWAYGRWQQARNTEDMERAALLGEQAVEWFAKAAPYIRPRLNAVEASVNVNVSIFDRIERGRQRLLAIAS